VEIFVDIF